MSRTDTAALWTRLKEAEVVEGEKPGAKDVVTPWYVRTMMGIAGWIGASFLLSFVAAGMTLLMESVPGVLTAGSLFCGAAAWVYKKGPDNEFLCQFAFAVSLAGQGLILYGLVEGLPSRDNTVALLMVAAETLLFFLMANFLHRVWSAMVGICGLLFLVGNYNLWPYAPAILTALFSMVWLNEFQYPGYGRHLQALGYGLSILLVACAVLEGAAWANSGFPWGDGTGNAPGGELSRLFGSLMTAIVFMVVVAKLMAKQGVSPGKGPGLALGAGAVALALASVKAQGTGATLVILLIGFAHGNRVLWGMGAMGLLLYLSQYYYSLEITLLQKSALLCCTGVALLFVRTALKYRWFFDEDMDGKDA